MSSDTPGFRRAGRWLGAVIFGAGVALLLVVFVLAAVTFYRLPQLLSSSSSGPRGIALPLAISLVRAVFLLVMAYVSSLLASKGLELLSTANTEGSP